MQRLSKHPGCGAPQGPGVGALCTTPLPEGGPEVGTGVTAPTLTTQQLCLAGSESSSPGGPSSPCRAGPEQSHTCRVGGGPPRISPCPAPTTRRTLREEPEPLPRPSGLCPAPAAVLVCSGC